MQFVKTNPRKKKAQMSKGKIHFVLKVPRKKKQPQKNPVLAASTSARSPAREIKICEFENIVNIPTFLG